MEMLVFKETTYSRSTSMMSISLTQVLLFLLTLVLNLIFIDDQPNEISKSVSNSDEDIESKGQKPVGSHILDSVQF